MKLSDAQFRAIRQARLAMARSLSESGVEDGELVPLALACITIAFADLVEAAGAQSPALLDVVNFELRKSGYRVAPV